MSDRWRPSISLINRIAVKLKVQGNHACVCVSPLFCSTYANTCFSSYSYESVSPCLYGHICLSCPNLSVSLICLSTLKEDSHLCSFVSSWWGLSTPAMWSSSFRKRRTAVSTQSHAHVHIFPWTSHGFLHKQAVGGCVRAGYASLRHLSIFMVSAVLWAVEKR